MTDESLPDFVQQPQLQGLEEPTLVARQDEQQVKEVVRGAKRRRIEEYLLDALEKPNHLEANIAVANSELMSLRVCIFEFLMNAMGDDAMSAEQFPKLMPALEVMSKLSRQSDRYSQLELRIANAREANRAPLPQ
jgi:hypothetical protein